MVFTDVLVIGSGLSGLVYAIKVAERFPHKKITIVTKSTPDESSTKYAQGGIAVVMDKLEDSFEKHIADTLRAGDGLCDKSVVEMVVRDAPSRIEELIEWGVSFDKNQQGDFDLGREGGHTTSRVIHHNDNTGEEVENVLLARSANCNNLSILKFHQALDLILNAKGCCIGAYVLDIEDKRVIDVLSSVTLLATGGSGHTYANTTNPLTSTGDGIALAQRAGATISYMQFVQFHPTAIYESNKNGMLSLATEALRGAGARLLNTNGDRFMSLYDERGELASRDIVSRAIYNEMHKYNSAYVYMDCRVIDKGTLVKHFPNIVASCMSKGLDIQNDLLPVVPASHYLCGGIDVDRDGQTNITNLFAIGECSNTGLHGANRLASNSLLEALVYGHNLAAKTVEVLIESAEVPVASNYTSYGLATNKEVDKIMGIKYKLNSVMSTFVSIVRTYDGLHKAKKEIDALTLELEYIYDYKKPYVEGENVRNLLSVSGMIVEQSIEQKENRGTYYNADLDENR